MILIEPLTFRTHTKHPPMPPPSTSPSPVLVRATYDAQTTVDLVFDRPIDLASFQSARVIVVDGASVEGRYDGSGGFERLSPTSVRVWLEYQNDDIAPGIHLSVPPDSGIVTDDGGSPWAGCENVALPFGL